jgi:hypothetical protein
MQGRAEKNEWMHYVSRMPAYVLPNKLIGER